jgi:hypothetical protein
VDRRADGHVVWVDVAADGFSFRACAGEAAAVLDSRALQELRGAKIKESPVPRSTKDSGEPVGVAATTHDALTALTQSIQTLKKPEPATKDLHGKIAPFQGMTIDRTDVFSVLRSLSAGVPKTETALKKKIAKSNPEMDRDLIRKQSGKYVLPTQHGPLPLTFPVVKGAELPTILDEAQLQDKFVVVVVLAVYASQSLFAMGQAQAALTELAKKHGEGMPYKFVAVELSESRQLPQQIREIAGSSKLALPPPPCCLMYYRGNEVHREKLAGSCERLRYPSLARPRILLVEPTPSHQLASEAALKRSGWSVDLALSVSEALQLARNEYGAVIASSELGADLKRVFDIHAHALPFLMHAATDRPLADTPPVKHIFGRPLRRTAVDSVLGRFPQLAAVFEHAGTNTKEFVAEVERVYNRVR